MRRRFLIPFLMLMAILVIGGAIAAIRLGVVERSAREYLIRRVSAELGADFDISSLSISPWFIGFRDVRLKMKDLPLTIEAKRIRIGFNLAALIRHRFKPVYGTERIFLDHPRLVWSLDSPGDSTHSFNFEKIPAIPIRKIPDIFIDLNSGSFAVSRNGEVVEIARNVSGWLDGRHGPVVDLKLEAKALSSRKNVTCSGTLNRQKESAQFDIRSVSCDLSRSTTKNLLGNLNMNSGELDFTLHVGQYGGVLSWDGKYRLHDCAFHIGKGNAGGENITASGRILRDQMTLDTVSGSVMGVYPRVWGRLTFGAKNRLELIAEADEVDLSKLVTHLSPRGKNPPEGRLRARIGVFGTFDSLITTASFSSARVNYKGNTLTDITLLMKADSSGVMIEEVGASVSGYRISGEGTLAGISKDRERRLSLNFSAKGTDSQREEYRLALNGTADPGDRNFTTKAEFLNLSGSPFVPERIAGTLSLRKNALDFSFESPGVRGTGKVAGLFSKPDIEARCMLMRFPVMRYAGRKSGELFLNGNIDLRGGPDDIDLSAILDLTGTQRLHASVSGRADVFSPFKSDRHIAAELRIDDFSVLNAPPNTFAVSMRADSSATLATVTDVKNDAWMSVRAMNGTGMLTGALRFRDYPLEKIVAIFTKESKNYQGNLTGEITVGGTIAEPRFFTPHPLHAETMTLGPFTRLSGAMMVSGKPGELHFTGVDLRRDRKEIVAGEGHWTSGKPFVFTGHGNGVEFGAIGDIISKDRKCDGLVDYDMTMAFSLSSGTVDGSFVIRNGHFMDIPFDRASAQIGGGSQRFIVSDFTVEKKDVYSGTGNAASSYIWKDTSGDQGLKLMLDLRGNLLPALPYLTPTIKSANGNCVLTLTLGGSWQEPVIVDGRATVSGGTVVPSFVDEKVTGISAEMVIDPKMQPASGLRAARLVSASGILNGTPISAKNVFETDEMWATVKRPELVDVVNSVIGLDFGVFAARIERGRDRARALELNIPGFMQPRTTGRFELTGGRGGWFVVGASPGSDHLTPYIGGTVRVLSGDITYPLIINPDSPAADSTALNDIYWDLEIFAGSSVYYVSENSKSIKETRIVLPFWKMNLPLAGATLSRVSAKLDEKSVFTVTGRFGDESYRVTGDARSTSGTVSYVGVEFDVEAVELDLNTARTVKPVILTARAKNTVVDDSTGIETDVYLKVNAVDKASGNRREATGRSDASTGGLAEESSELSWIVDVLGFGSLEIQFVSTNPSDNTRERVFARLGISPENAGGAATRALAQGMDEYYLNFMRPIERMIRKYTGLDVVRFTPMVIGNLVRSKLVLLDRFGSESDYLLFDGSYVMFGEYFMDGFFLSYRGEYGLARDFLQRKKHGFYHEVGLQYPLRRNTKLQFNFDYDNVIRQSDKRIEIQHDFAF